MEQNTFIRWIGAGTFGLVLWLFAPFLKSFSIALLLAMATSPLHKNLMARIRRYEWFQGMAPMWAAGAVTLVLSVLFFLPIALFLYHLLDHPANTIAMIRSLGSKIDTATASLPAFLSWLKDPLENLIEIATAHRDEIIGFFAEWLGSGLKTFMTMMAEMTMIVVFFFFLSWYGRSLNLFLLPIIPLSRSVKREFLSEITTTTAVVFYTFVGVMIAQGMAFGIFIAFFEGYNPFLLGFMTGISAIIPVVGTALIWVPIALHEYFDGHIFNAILISIYSWAMMAFFIDNIVKLVILNYVNKTLSSGHTRMNEFVIFFAMVAGLATFGFWGFILGPAMIAFAVTVLRTMRRERTALHRRPKHRF